VSDLAPVEGVGEPARKALARRYGYGAHEVLALAAERPELGEPIVAGLPDLAAEVAIAVRREQARSVGDVLLRRTRLGLIAARELLGEERGASSSVGRVAALMAAELGWSEQRATAEGERFYEEAHKEGILGVG
jgi:glycerol-3-phosphate dehydrogenase